MYGYARDFNSCTMTAGEMAGGQRLYRGRGSGCASGAVKCLFHLCQARTAWQSPLKHCFNPRWWALRRQHCIWGHAFQMVFHKLEPMTDLCKGYGEEDILRVWIKEHGKGNKWKREKWWKGKLEQWLEWKWIKVELKRKEGENTTYVVRAQKRVRIKYWWKVESSTMCSSNTPEVHTTYALWSVHRNKRIIMRGKSFALTAWILEIYIIQTTKCLWRKLRI